MRRDPAVLLLLASERAEMLRSQGEDTIDGQRHRLITFSAPDGAQIGLAFDATTGLLARVQTLADNSILGDTLTETVLSDYREVPVGAGRVRLPYRAKTIVGGETTQDLVYTSLAVNTGPRPGSWIRQPTPPACPRRLRAPVSS
jgi:hypothetical protein